MITYSFVPGCLCVIDCSRQNVSSTEQHVSVKCNTNTVALLVSH